MQQATRRRLENIRQRTVRRPVFISAREQALIETCIKQVEQEQAVRRFRRLICGLPRRPYQGRR